MMMVMVLVFNGGGDDVDSFGDDSDGVGDGGNGFGHVLHVFAEMGMVFMMVVTVKVQVMIVMMASGLLPRVCGFLFASGHWMWHIWS